MRIMGQCGCQPKNPRLVSVEDLKQIIFAEYNERYRIINRPFDEVYDNIVIGGGTTALDEDQLQQLGITHVLNAAQGTKQFIQVDTNAQFYTSGIIFHGIPAIDIPTYNINKYFKEASNFIASAVGSKKGGKKDGRIFVHCKAGVSRSATFVIAYLMTYQDMNLTDAVRTIRNKRKVHPNAGFLRQLIDYATKLDKCR